MKKFLTIFLTFFVTGSCIAQNYEEIKSLILVRRYDNAKRELDKGMADEQFRSKPEAYALKSMIYSALADDPQFADQGHQLREEAYAAFSTFRNMQPNMELLQDPTFKYAPADLHTSFFNSGYKDYQQKKWEDGLAKFEKVIVISDLMIAKNLTSTSLDTNALILAGVMAENAGKADIAATYYRRLAEAGIHGPAFEDLYRFLVRYYFSKKDFVTFDKFKALGQQAYPQSEFFKYDKTDFAVGLVDGFVEKLQELGRLAESEPENYQASFLFGQVIYDTLYSEREGAVKPASAQELEQKMVAAFKKASAIDPTATLPNLYLGEFYMKLVFASGQNKITGRDLDNAYEGARTYYENAAAIFARKQGLSNPEQQQYKNVAAYLSDIYTYKKDAAKDNPAAVNDYSAQAKKWNDLYNSMR
ncbi:MAG: hypothetical protein EOO09_20885 [Chitinophagaceae bacterium]|nr:MAG: hypothetical protein EOO09_20885 [Chitinophagaceae bacterium]